MAFRSRREPSEDLAAIMRRVRSEGIAAYGALAVGDDDLRAHVARVVARDRAIDGIEHAADLFLACAADADVPGAWEVLRRVHGDAVCRMLQSRGVPDATARDVVEGLPGALIAEPGGGGGRTRLGSYDGSGSLRSWLGIVAMRAVITERRRVQRAERAVAHRARTHGVPPDPALLASDAELGSRFARRLRAAWDELPPRWRLALALRYVQGLPGAEIARVLGVGAPRVTRIVEAAIDNLRASLESEIASSSAPPPATLRALLGAELARRAAVDLPLAGGVDPVAPG
ncbi:MAG: sigma-70 family RNA polymerase sigma factor [Planctomycetes bacterium]|nr:sigma-70 family RNA polymerase sigma factor [Planctomycetota bacterium]